MKKSILLLFLISCAPETPMERKYIETLSEFENSPYFIRNKLSKCLYLKRPNSQIQACFEALRADYEPGLVCRQVKYIATKGYCRINPNICRYLEQECQIILDVEEVEVPKKLDECVNKVKKQGKSESSAWAICKDSLGLTEKDKKKKKGK